MVWGDEQAFDERDQDDYDADKREQADSDQVDQLAAGFLGHDWHDYALQQFLLETGRRREAHRGKFKIRRPRIPNSWTAKPKGRQGRSHESRRRAEEARRAMSHSRTQDSHVCVSCGGDLLLDSHTGDTLCQECGIVSDSFYAPDNAGYRQTFSRPYQCHVYFRERIAQTLGRDPEIYPHELEIISREVGWREAQDDKLCLDELAAIEAGAPDEATRRVLLDILARKHAQRKTRRWGKRTWTEILRSVDEKYETNFIQKKYPERWVQLNVFFGYMEPPVINEYKLDIVKKMVYLVERAFRAILKDEIRHNIISIHYIWIQCDRLVERMWRNPPENDEQTSRFIDSQNTYVDHALTALLPQVKSKSKMMQNNFMWRMMIEYIKEKGWTYFNHKTDEWCGFVWHYMPLTQALVFNRTAFV